MMSRLIRVSVGFMAIVLSVAAVADEPVIYPAKGQSAEQRQKDDGECYSWAKGNTGIDPVALAAAPPAVAPPPAAGGRRVGGALKGAVVGTIVTDNSDGAKAGAVVGALGAGAKARQQSRAQATQQQQQVQQEQTQHQQKMATYYRAHGACMEGRGYVVK